MSLESDASGRRWRSTAPPSVLPDISPSSGEIGGHLCFRQSPALQERRRSRRCQSPPGGEMSGRTEGGAIELDGGCWLDIGPQP
ncbi:hypothetical protein FJ976_29455, partial [Mesorhizobium sp. B1-1-9]